MMLVNCPASEYKVTMEESFIFQTYFMDYVHRPSI